MGYYLQEALACTETLLQIKNKVDITWTFLQLVPIDLIGVLIGLEEEWKWVREHNMLFCILEMLVKNSKLYKNLSFGDTQRTQYSIVSGYAEISSKIGNNFEL